MPPIKLKLNLGAISSPMTPTPKSAPAGPSEERLKASKAKSKGRSGRSPHTAGGLGLTMGAMDAEEEDERSVRGGRDEEDTPDSKPTIRLNISSLNSPAPASVVSSPSSTPMSVTPVSTPGPGPSDQPKRKRGRPPKKRPTAIPPHLVTPRTTPRSSFTGFSTPTSEVDIGEDIDPLSLPLSPHATNEYPLNADTPPADSETVEFTPRRTQWKRVKRPFNELANKVLAEMRRKDSYGFFLEPVSIEEYPDYYERIGGEDKAMDLGTMQNKLDYGEYRNMDQLETDFRKVIDACKAFNAEGTAPIREADKVFTHGMKHLNRNRPLVLTPSPSPSPTQQNSPLPESTRSTPRPTGPTKSGPTIRLEKDVPPKKRIPSDMLEFPANSLQAMAVGWNQTGGRRVRAKRFVRGRERFTGRWRDFCPDGSRDIAEMDDPAAMLEIFRTRNGESQARVIDWPKMRKEEGDWWEWEGLGGATGQPPLPNTERLKPKPMLYRELAPIEFGPYPELKDELRQLKKAAKPPAKEQPLEEFEALENHLRPPAPAEKVPAGTPAQSFVNIYERRPPMDFLYYACLGGVRAEAYSNSVQKFLDGALGKVGSESGSTEGAQMVREYVATKWHDGVLQGPLGRVANDAANAVNDAVKAHTEGKAVEGDGLKAADAAYAAIALRDLTSPLNPLDLAPLLRDPSEFLYPGIGAKSGVLSALGWISNEIQKQAKDQDAWRAEERRRAEARDREEAEKKRVAIAIENKAMDVETPVPNGVCGVKRSSAEVEGEEPEAKRARLASPKPDVVPSTAANVPNGQLATPAAPATPATPAPAPQTTPASTTTVNPATAPQPQPDLEAMLKQLRLELVAVSKFYPLASLKKMSKEQAKALLPATVRGLMTRSE